MKRWIDKALDRILPSGKAPAPRSIHKAMRYSVFSGGKRIRPIIAIEAAKACGGRQQDALAAACAIELVHTYSLIHDDLPSMDDDDYRRGRPSCHKAFGEAAAILAGDALLTLAFEAISGDFARRNPKAGIEIVRELSRAAGAKGMAGGQAEDIEFQNKKKSKEKLHHINRFKTAKLFEASAGIGAIAAGAGKKARRALADYGASLGMAFQIVDDIIDGECYAGTSDKDRARREAEGLIEKAKRALKIFGKKSERLIETADNVLARLG